MSDNAQVNVSTNSDTTKRKPNLGLIISVAAIIISICVGGLFNEEIRDFLNLSSPSQTPEKIESVPAN